MKAYNIFFLFIISSNISCIAQNYEKPVKIIQDIPAFGDPIQYKFPYSVTQLIDSTINKSFSNRKYFIVLFCESDAYRLHVYSLPIRQLDSTEQFDIMLSSTHRYYLYNSTRIPVFFDYDYKFSFMTSYITHSDKYILFRCKHWSENGEIIENE